MKDTRLKVGNKLYTIVYLKESILQVLNFTVLIVDGLQIIKPEYDRIVCKWKLKKVYE